MVSSKNALSSHLSVPGLDEAAIVTCIDRPFFFAQLIELLAEPARQPLEAGDFLLGIGILPVEVDPVVVELVHDLHHGPGIAVFRLRLGDDGGELLVPPPAAEREKHPDARLVGVVGELAAGHAPPFWTRPSPSAVRKAWQRWVYRPEVDVARLAEEIADEDLVRGLLAGRRQAADRSRSRPARTTAETSVHRIIG